MSAPSSPAEEEAAPLIPPDPSDLEAGRRSEDSAANSILSFGEDRKHSDPLYVKIFYSLSVLVSVGGLIAAAVGFSIVCRNVFDKSAQRDRWRSYTEYPWGMLMPILLVGGLDSLARVWMATDGIDRCRSMSFGVAIISTGPPRGSSIAFGFSI